MPSIQKSTRHRANTRAAKNVVIYLNDQKGVSDFIGSSKIVNN